MTTSIHLLMRHMRWADQRVFRSLVQVEQVLPDALTLFGHIAAAERIYLERIEGIDPFPQDFWPQLTLEEAAATSQKAWDELTQVVERTSDLSQLVRYRNSRGTYFETPVEQMLLHLFLHGEHHRGQIASLVREAGGTPAVTDMITFVREEAVG